RDFERTRRGPVLLPLLVKLLWFVLGHIAQTPGSFLYLTRPNAALVAATPAAPRVEEAALDGHSGAPGCSAPSASTTDSSESRNARRSYPPSVTATIRPSQHSSAVSLSAIVIAPNAGVVRRIPPSGSRSCASSPGDTRIRSGRNARTTGMIIWSKTS